MLLFGSFCLCWDLSVSTLLPGFLPFQSSLPLRVYPTVVLLVSCIQVFSSWNMQSPVSSYSDCELPSWMKSLVLGRSFSTSLLLSPQSVTSKLNHRVWSIAGTSSVLFSCWEIHAQRQTERQRERNTETETESYTQKETEAFRQTETETVRQTETEKSTPQYTAYLYNYITYMKSRILQAQV